jgi:hypothetical protein
LQQFDSNNPPPPMKQLRDSIIFRYKPNSKLLPFGEQEEGDVEKVAISVMKIVSEMEFINEFKKPPGNHYWQTIDYV